MTREPSVSYTKFFVQRVWDATSRSYFDLSTCENFLVGRCVVLRPSLPRPAQLRQNSSSCTDCSRSTFQFLLRTCVWSLFACTCCCAGPTTPSGFPLYP